MSDISKLLKNLEYVLLLVTVLSFVYIGYFLTTQNKAVNVSFSSVGNGHDRSIPSKVTEDIILIQPKPFDFYDQKIKARDIFSDAAPIEDNPATAVASVPSGQLPANLKVVGILLSDNTQVVVEDRNAHQTYFVDQQSTQAGMKVDHVEKNKIFLNYQNQMIAIDLKGAQINVTSSTTPNN